MSLATSAELGHAAKLGSELAHAQSASSARIGVLQHELVLGRADRRIDREILHGLHVESDAGTPVVSSAGGA